MDFATFSDPFIKVAFLTGIAAFAFSFLMVLAIATLRVRLLYRLRRERQLIARWRPLLARVYAEVPATLPALARRDRVLFLHLWNHYHESLRGEVKRNLNEFAQRVGAAKTARRLLKRRAMRVRLLAATSLGYLKDDSEWPTLLALTRDHNPVLALAAARALVSINTQAVVSEIVLLIAERDDWSLAQAGKLLSEAGRQAIAGPLLAALDSVPEAAQRRLLQLVQILGVEGAAPVVRRILRQSKDSELIAAGLRTLRSPADNALARNFLRHPQAFVRIAAVQALGRLGTEQDVPVITELLADRDWWVRYRAAEALCDLLSVEQLARIGATLQDRYGRDMLRHVASERKAQL